ncbi:MAG: hypothetical protein UT33_C0018G0021 [Candidatus Peregrinibacteria bacterium GW2011_GWC2_39_14]|nr:MAG: hypothetical protein US92_C0003G0008 [Candidatus Peregrinibacteria bacterium GW2011_GWA2_38_36]KKR04669.1 MAG: hypothetical protein UT33_C0018G0021 [Candidatus Peregrinibacteria bacterium GW2011_GWC2_39_14]
MSTHVPPDDAGERRGNNPQREYFNRLTPAERALWIADHRFHMKRPTDLNAQTLPGGEDTRRDISALFDRLEARPDDAVVVENAQPANQPEAPQSLAIDESLDAARLDNLRRGFDTSVAIWEEAGLFTSEREANGYAKPNFDTHYLPRMNQGILELAEDGEGLNKGYNVPVFTPLDVPVYSEKPDVLSYYKLLEEALRYALNTEVSGKPKGYILVGSRSEQKDEAVVDKILKNWKNLFSSGRYIFESREFKGSDRLGTLMEEGLIGGLSEQGLLQSLTGVEKVTGGVLRFERAKLIQPEDVGDKKMGFKKWMRITDDPHWPLGPLPIPKEASHQNLKEAIAYAILCLKTKGMLPDYCGSRMWDENETCIAPRTIVIAKTAMTGSQDVCCPAFLSANGGRYIDDWDKIGYTGNGPKDGVRDGVRIN